MDREEAMHENGNVKLERMVRELTGDKVPACVQVEHNPFDRKYVPRVLDGRRGKAHLRGQFLRIAVPN